MNWSWKTVQTTVKIKMWYFVRLKKEVQVKGDVKENAKEDWAQQISALEKSHQKELLDENIGIEIKISRLMYDQKSELEKRRAFLLVTNCSFACFS